ncbi:MAG: RNA polymerase sigma factor [Verrucomicrobiae bacterium]|nr:RNA polymerase sigma factor [Verrucomicrobiae bacterium]
MDEHRAIELCVKHRDPVGFEFLVRKYRREAFRHAFVLLGNAEDALDACQDAFAKAFVAITRLSSLSEFYPWFYRILRNRCLNLIARRTTSQKYQADEHQNKSETIDERNPVGILERREEEHRVWQAMEQLTPEQREILAMKYILGHSYNEIARTLGIPRGTVMSRLYHARMAFRQSYLDLVRAETPGRNKDTL